MADLGIWGGRDNHRVYKFKLVKQGTAEWQRHAQPDGASGGGASGGGEPAAAAAAAAADYVAPSFQGSLGKRKVRISMVTFEIFCGCAYVDI